MQMGKIEFSDPNFKPRARYAVQGFPNQDRARHSAKLRKAAQYLLTLADELDELGDNKILNVQENMRNIISAIINNSGKLEG